MVNEDDEVVDSKPGIDCIRQGILHRAIVVFLLDSHGRVYLQKRAERATWYPGYWTTSVTGHVSAGESYQEAAKREVREELGLDVKLKEVTKFRTPRWKYREMVEQEYITVFESRAKNPKIILSDESKEGIFVPYGEFAKQMKFQNRKFTPDTILAFDQYDSTRRKSGS